MPMEEDEQRQANMAAIIDSSEDAIISKDLNGIIQSWNKAAERMFGYAEAEVLGRHISILIPKERQTEEDMIIAHLRAGKRVEHYQTIRLTKTGREVNISLTVSPVRNKAGVVVGASKIARDVTKQREAEEKLSRYAHQLEQINATSRAIAAESDVEKILQRVTDVTTELTGAAFGAFFYNKTDTTGESYMLYSLSGAPREAFEKFGMPRNTAIFSKTFNGEGIFRSDDITQDPRYGKNAPHKGMPQGHLPVVSYLAVPVISPSGFVIGGLFFGHPNKAVFNAEHEVLLAAIASIAAVSLDKARLFDEVQVLNAKKDQFISFASHELKTPLTTIKGYLQLTHKNPELSQTLLPKLNKQVDRLAAIISDLLDISKIKAGALNLNYVSVKLKRLIGDSIETAKDASSYHIFQAELPAQDITLLIDEQKIGQVIINLLTNAAKFSAEGTEIVLKAIHLGDTIQVSIRDKGIGIAKAHLEKIFNQFYRVSEPGQRTDGLGLGLYLSKEIIEAHHGKIWAESRLDEGSVFTIEFPIENRNAG